MNNYKVLISDSRIAKRLDAEYFQPKFLKLNQNLKKNSTTVLSELCEFIQSGPAGSVLSAKKYSKDGGVKVIRPSNMDGWSCDKGSFVYVEEEFCMEAGIKICKKGDVLVSRIGDVKFGIVEDEELCTISPNLIVIRTKAKRLDPYFLLAFLNSEFGMGQFTRWQKRVSMSSVAATQINDLVIPDVEIEDQKRIGHLVSVGLEKKREAKKVFEKAEGLLMSYIGGDKKEGSGKDNLRQVGSVDFLNIKKIKRADAEYFLQNKLSENNFSREYKTMFNKNLLETVELGDVAKVIRGIDPGRSEYVERGKMFFRVGNMGKFGLTDKSQKFISNKLYEKLRAKFQPKRGEVLVVKDGKPGVACVLDEDKKGIISDGIIRLRIKDDIEFSAEYLALCINSGFCQMQIKRDIDGSLVPHWKIEQIKKLRIPILEKGRRGECAKVIKVSYKLFKSGERKMRRAKKSAEELIELSFN